ncbi:septum formation initiator family protein [Erythrobacter sp. THAF29]|uniref:FtsB family cell division protein n=1 Tax=Erythrobacter sp. THAF29 TaxID=2587851 RepID=UPI0012698046|nr:septum formation initiator family protein [Erythrobacter sp. THAF29]QFT77950.1 Septum formation initiator [Erythrobacter sp. THAF29]
MRKPVKEQMRQSLALFVLLLLTGFAIAGPTGLLAWSENAQTLEHHRAQIAELEAERAALRNRVELLDPRAADPDLASELVRKNLGVLHADEVVITIEDE